MNHLPKLACAALLAFACTATQAQQAFPVKPVRIIVGYTSGSTVDVMARTIAAKLPTMLGQQVLVENRPGAAGSVGTEATARAPKDGYTMLLAALGFAVVPSLTPNLSWDPIKDFAPISQVATSPLVIVVHPSVPAKNLKELIALAKARPGKLRYAHAGIGSSQHMAGELLAAEAGIDIVNVPYKGNEEMLTDLLGNRLEMNFQGMPTVLPQIRAGKVRAIVLTGPKRAAALPDVQTMAEAGLPAATVTVWFGLLAPAGTPRDIVNRLNTAVVTAMKSPDVAASFAKFGSDATSSTPEEFARLIREQVATWAKVIKQRGIKVQ